MTTRNYQEEKKARFGTRLTKQAVVNRKKSASVGMEMQTVAGILGYLTTLIPFDEVSLAHLACPELIDKYTEFLSLRKGELPRKDGNSLYSIAKIVEYVAGETSFAADLTPIPGVLDAEDVEFMKYFWHEHGMDAAEAIRDIAQREVNDSVLKVDNTKAIKEILLSEEPMTVIFDMIHILMDRVESATAGIARAIALRDLFVIAVLICQAVFRPGTIGLLDNSDVHRSKDKVGKTQLRLVVQSNKFKNEKQPILRDGFNRKIIDLFGQINSLTEEYLDHSRELIVGEPTKILVVNTAANPRFDSDSFGNYLRRLTGRLLTRDLHGKYRPLSISCTQFRKIVATAIKRAYPEDKKGTKIAETLMNQIPWVYAWIAASERSEGIESFLSKVNSTT
jgi:hypothetical protein